MRYKKIEGGERLSGFIRPMLAQLTDRPPFDDTSWLFEIKWDGYRAIAETSKKAIRLYSRNGLSFAKAYTKVFDELKKISKAAVLDGEIVVFDERDRPSFQKLQNYSNNSSYIIHYFVFDILSLDGKSVTALPLIKRKQLLKSILPKSNVIRYCDHVLTKGKALFHEIEKGEMEGMIAKQVDSRYHIGKRTTEWLKIKNVKSDEAIIIGYTAPKGSRFGFGSLLLAQHIYGELTYVGNVGTGFSDETLRKLSQKMQRLQQSGTSLTHLIKPPPSTTWVKPELVCNIKFTEKTSDGIVRHPVFLGLRTDKKATEVLPEKPIEVKTKKQSRKK